MFGAGLIKLRGDPCWRNLTCLNYYFETQPMPNALSWYFHWLPHGIHTAGVVFNHIAEVIVPFAYFAPQPFRVDRRARHDRVSGRADRVRQPLVAELAHRRAVHSADQRQVAVVAARVHPPATFSPEPAFHMAMYLVAGLVALMSIGPVINMLSSRQMMNASFDPLHLVNTYGAFGSVTRERYEIVLEGSDDGPESAAAVWKDTSSRASPAIPRAAAAGGAVSHAARLAHVVRGDGAGAAERLVLQHAGELLQGDRDTLSLLRTNPFRSSAALHPRAVLPL